MHAATTRHPCLILQTQPPIGSRVRIPWRGQPESLTHSDRLPLLSHLRHEVSRSIVANLRTESSHLGRNGMRLLERIEKGFDRAIMLDDARRTALIQLGDQLVAIAVEVYREHRR